MKMALRVPRESANLSLRSGTHPNAGGFKGKPKGKPQFRGLLNKDPPQMDFARKIGAGSASVHRAGAAGLGATFVACQSPMLGKGPREGTMQLFDCLRPTPPNLPTPPPSNQLELMVLASWSQKKCRCTVIISRVRCRSLSARHHFATEPSFRLEKGGTGERPVHLRVSALPFHHACAECLIDTAGGSYSKHAYRISVLFLHCSPPGLSPW